MRDRDEEEEKKVMRAKSVHAGKVTDQEKVLDSSHKMQTKRGCKSSVGISRWVDGWLFVFWVLVGWMSVGMAGVGWAATSRPAAQLTLERQMLLWVSEHSKAFFQKHGHTGLSIGVVTEQGLLGSRHWGYADLANQRKADDHTLYGIGSITKVFTAMLTVQLRDQGKLRLDDHLQQFLPKGTRVPTDPRGLPHIQLKHLLTHTSGLPGSPHNVTPKGQDVYNHYSESQMLSALSSMSLEYPVGSQYQYSNFGYALLGYVLQVRTRQSYAALLARYILRPLGMSETRMMGTQRHPQQAWGYGDKDPKALAVVWNLGSFGPAGGIMSSVHDMARWMMLQWKAGQPNSTPVSGGSLAEMQTVHRLLGWSRKGHFSGGVGWGWHIFPLQQGKDLVVWHNGGLAGYRSFFGFSPAIRKGVIIFTNCGRSVDALGFSVMEEMSKRFWKPPQQPIHPRLQVVSEQFKTCFSGAPSSAWVSMFSPAFLAQFSATQLQGMFALYHKSFGAVVSVDLKPSRSTRVGIAHLQFQRGKTIRVLVGIDTSQQGQINMLYFLPDPPKQVSPRSRPVHRKHGSPPTTRPQAR